MTTHEGKTMDAGTKLDQVAAVSRLLSGAYGSDEVVIRTSEPVEIDRGVKRVNVVLSHSRGGKALPLSEIHASIDVVKQGHSYAVPSWGALIDALHKSAMAVVGRMAAKAAEIAAAGKVTP